jgi:hypothetical protein
MNTIVNSNYYPAPAAVGGGSVDGRVQLQQLGTDYLWKCSGWSFARSWVQHGGSAYVGEYQVGASYPGNDEVSFCTEPGKVCHQDDIQIVVSSFCPIISPCLTLPCSSAPRQILTLTRQLSSRRCKLATSLSSPAGTQTHRVTLPGRLRPLPMFAPNHSEKPLQ